MAAAVAATAGLVALGYNIMVGAAPAVPGAGAPSQAVNPTGSTPIPSSAAPTAASSTPTPKPSTSRSTAAKQPDRSLKKNSLYKVDLGHSQASCAIKVRRPKPPLRDSALAPYLRTLVGCMTTTLSQPLAAEGITLTKPRVKTYTKSTNGPCGKLTKAAAPASYCGADNTIYWPVAGDDGSQAYTYARLGYLGNAAHEFGHHIQFASGILANYGERYYATKSKTTRYLLSRRLELQAQCFEGVFLASVGKSIKLSSRDRYELRLWHGLTGDEDPPAGRRADHGTSAAQIRWLMRGLDSGDYSKCNTWSANKSSVK
jgi:predicted metalloprotease